MREEGRRRDKNMIETCTFHDRNRYHPLSRSWQLLPFITFYHFSLRVFKPNHQKGVRLAFGKQPPHPYYQIRIYLTVEKKVRAFKKFRFKSIAKILTLTTKNY